MAISRAVARLLVELAAELRPGGRVLQLGEQSVHASATELGRYAAAVGLEPRPPVGRGPAGALFGYMGYTESHSIDLYDGRATHRIDLDEPVPGSMVEQYDTVLDGGTLEHVYSTAQVLENMHAVLRDGGLAIHISPSNNYVDHGYYCFGPRFFYEHYRANGYRIETVQLLHHSRRWARGPHWVVPYTPGSVDRWSMGGFEKGQLLTLAVARKVPGATSGRRPEPRASGGLGAPSRRQAATRILASVTRRALPGTSVLGRRPGPFARGARRV